MLIPLGIRPFFVFLPFRSFFPFLSLPSSFPLFARGWPLIRLIQVSRGSVGIFTLTRFANGVPWETASYLSFRRSSKAVTGCRESPSTPLCKSSTVLPHDGASRCFHSTAHTTSLVRGQFRLRLTDRLHSGFKHCPPLCPLRDSG